MKYKPEISVVRPAIGTPAWVLTGLQPDIDGAIPVRALLVRGVPMVGERVALEDLRAEVVGYNIMLRLRGVGSRDPGWWDSPATEWCPVSSDDEALVDRVRDALAGVGCDLLTDNEIRVALRARDEYFATKE